MDIRKYAAPRPEKVAVPLPKDEELAPGVLAVLKKLPALNNLRMLAWGPKLF